MELTYRYRLYPTATQRKKIQKTCGCARLVYNQLLSYRTNLYRETLSWVDVEPELNRLLEKHLFLREVDINALHRAKQQLESAYRKFFRMEKKGDRYRPASFARSQQDPNYELLETDLMGYPRYKLKKYGTQSYSTESEAVSIDGNRIVLPGIGKVKIKLHRPLPENAAPVYYTVMAKASGNFFLLVHLHLPDVPRKENKSWPIGIVFDPSHLAVRSDGEKVHFRHEDPAMRKKIKKAKRVLDRRVPGSKGYAEAYKRLAKLNEKRTNQRWDSQHKEARLITKAADTFFCETPDVRVRKPRWSVMPGMGHLIWDESWWMFSQMISYKAALEGKTFLRVPKDAPIYEICSVCEKPVPKIPKQDDWTCPFCGVTLNSELNAALNLRNQAKKFILDWDRYVET